MRDGGLLVSRALRNRRNKGGKTPLLIRGTESRSHLHVLINSALEQRVVQTGSGNNWKCCKLFCLAICYPRNKTKPSHLLWAVRLHRRLWFPAYPGARNRQIPHLAGAVWLSPSVNAVVAKEKGIEI